MTMKVIEGKISGVNWRFGIAVSRFNNLITDKLLTACLDSLKENGVDMITVTYVPGAFELPIGAQHMAKTGQFDAIICLGCVIRGGTPHFEYICAETTRGIGEVALRHNIPVIFGVLTTDSSEQALERSAKNDKNKGREAALSALEMVNMLDGLGKSAD